jgi:hypothetical protein
VNTERKALTLNDIGNQNELLMKRHNRRKDTISSQERDGSSTDSSLDPTLDTIIERVRSEKSLVTEMLDRNCSLIDETKKRKLKMVTLVNGKRDHERCDLENMKKLKTQQLEACETNGSPASIAETDSSSEDRCRSESTLCSKEPPPKYFFKLLRDAFKLNAKQKRLNMSEVEHNLKHQFAKLDIIYTFSQDIIQSGLYFLKSVLPTAQVCCSVDELDRQTRWEWTGTDTVNELKLSQLCEKWCNELMRNSSSQTQSIPAPIYPTTWTVRPSNEEEKKRFRLQETKRYERAHQAFTYNHHGYSSVVGPVKGCTFVKDSTIHCNSLNKARDHSLLVKDRPPFVTLLSIVRDSVARLPNGEGTKAEIAVLLKDSQFLLANITDQQLSSILARNMDRLHCERDPCVKFDSSRRLWIYLHRNRSELDFERMHRMQLEANKMKRTLTRIQKKPTVTNTLPKKSSSDVSSSLPQIVAPSFTTISTAKSNLESPVLENTTNGNIQFTASSSIKDEPEVGQDSPTGTLVPISLNSDPSLSTIQAVKLKKSSRPKRKLVDHLNSLSLKSEQLKTVEVENKEISAGSNQSKLVKLKPIKKDKKLIVESTNGTVSSQESSKPSSINSNNSSAPNVFHVNGNSGTKTAVIITKPMMKGVNGTAIKLPKQIQIHTQPSNNNSSVTHRISIPTSMLFNANGGPVVLGKAI